MKIKVMAVDDDPVSLLLLKSMLGYYGYEVLAVDDSRDAWKLLGVEKVDGLFLDFTLPGIEQKLSLNGQVVRKVPDGGIGMKFVGLPSREKSHLQRYISKCLED